MSSFIVCVSIVSTAIGFATEAAIAQTPAAAIPIDRYALTKIAPYSSVGGFSLNNFGQVAGLTSYPNAAFLWTPTAANSTTGVLTNVGGLSAGAGVLNLAGSINDRGQVVGTTLANSVDRAFLWSPNEPNHTTGSLIPFLDGATNGASNGKINKFGQIAGIYRSGFYFFWTPSAPNGTVGSLNMDDHFSHSISAINDAGQAVINGGPAPGFTLFTPVVANGATGLFTAINGLPGALASAPRGINRDGTIVGNSLFQPSQIRSERGFLWTPVSPNGFIGAVKAIPLPAGYVGLSATALNTNGQVVGQMYREDRLNPTPFLYSNGILYDLSTASPDLTDAAPMSINDFGQIVLNGSREDVYLLTPQAPQQPSITSVRTSGGATSIAPNDWIEIKGTHLAPSTIGQDGLTWSGSPEFAVGGMPIQLQGVSVKVNEKSAFVSYVSPSQINVLTPLDIAEGVVSITVTNGSNTSTALTTMSHSASPSFLLLGATHYPIATHADGALLGSASLSSPGYRFTPAQPSETVVLYAVGFGLPVSNLTGGSSRQFGELPALPDVTIGGFVATVGFAGVISPGLYQLNLTIPIGVPDGDNTVIATYRGITTQEGVAIAVQR